MRFVVLQFILFISSLNVLLAQDTITIYYNDDWKEIADKNHATYYRKSFLDSNHAWVVYDYFMSNKIQMKGTFTSKKLTIKHGHFIYYYENGRKQSEGEYINNKHEGLWTYWHENGKKNRRGYTKTIYCKTNGHIGMITDRKSHPEYTEMINQKESGNIGTIVVKKNRREHITRIKLKENGGIIINQVNWKLKKIIPMVN